MFHRRADLKYFCEGLVTRQPHMFHAGAPLPQTNISVLPLSPSVNQSINHSYCRFLQWRGWSESIGGYDDLTHPIHPI